MPDQTQDVPSLGPRRQPSTWNIANALTATRILLVPLFGWLLLRADGADDSSRMLAFLVFAVAMMTDRADGQLARQRGLVTDVGKIADPIADKALTGMAFVGLSLLGELPWWVTVVVLARELGITVLRFAVIRRGIIPASRGGKLKTVLQAIALGLYVLPLPSELWPLQAAAMALAVAVTVATGVDYVLGALRPPSVTPEEASQPGPATASDQPGESSTPGPATASDQPGEPSPPGESGGRA